VSVLSIKEFPDDLHRDAKVAAARRDEPLRELVIRALRAELERLTGEEA
jgi:hypothetical protein